MANNGVMGFGFVLLIIAGIGWFAPVTVEGDTYPQLNSLCASGLMTSPFATVFGNMMYGKGYQQSIEEECDAVATITKGIVFIGIIGLIVIAVGWTMDGKKKGDEPKQVSTSLEILKERYAKGEISKEEFERIKKDLE